jgi:hypothetical protein
MLRIPRCLDNRLTDSGEAVSSKHRPRSTPQKHYFSASATHFCWRLSKPLGLVLPKGLGKLNKFIHLIGSRTCHLPACSIVYEYVYTLQEKFRSQLKFQRSSLQHILRLSVVCLHHPLRSNGLQQFPLLLTFQIRNSRTFPVESFAHDSGRASVRAECGYPKGSPHTNC